MEAATGFEPVNSGFANRCHLPAKHCRTNSSGSQHPVLASCLATLKETCPRLAAIVDGWPDLPEPIRAAILALVNSATEKDQ